MTQSKHTPGPWKVAVGNSVRAGKKNICSHVNVQDQPKSKDGFLKRKAENEANARLIAESPTMHDLLLKLQAVRSPRELHNLRCEVAEVLARIEGV